MDIMNKDPVKNEALMECSTRAVADIFIPLRLLQTYDVIKAWDGEKLQIHILEKEKHE